MGAGSSQGGQGVCVNEELKGVPVGVGVRVVVNQ